MLTSLSTLTRRWYRRWLYGFMSLFVALGVIVANPQPTPAIPWIDLIIRGVQVLQLANLSDSQEVQLGQQINAELTSQEFRLYTDRNITQYVDQIGQRLVPFSDRPNIPYVFQVVNDDRINAFATMGGYVYVTTGLMAAAENEAELAGVIGHEIGHITSRHAVEQLRETAVAQGIATAAGVDRNVAVSIGVDLAIRRPNSRRDELEADQKGLTTLTRAGYAPIAMVTFMEKLLSGGSLPAFLSTHPATSDRIEALNAQIDDATARAGSGLDSAAYRSRIRSLL